MICDGASPVPITSGVPQGTVLDPLLFPFYVNDLPGDLESSVRLFADDTLLYATIANEKDTIDLQGDLRQLEIWQQKWQMEFIPSKCKMMCITSKRNPLPKRQYYYYYYY